METAVALLYFVVNYLHGTVADFNIAKAIWLAVAGMARISSDTQISTTTHARVIAKTNPIEKDYLEHQLVERFASQH